MMEEINAVRCSYIKIILIMISGFAINALIFKEVPVFIDI